MCTHTKVTDIYYVLDYYGRAYSGYCNDCETMVHGHISNRWKVGWANKQWDSEKLNKIF